MKRIMIATALIFSTVVSAHADQMIYHWYDTIRPHGHKRPDAVGLASVAKCNAEYGNADDGLPPGFKECMQRQGYRLISAVDHRSPRTTAIYDRNSRDPNVGWHTENGMRVCHNDCDNPEIPGSGAVCKNVNVMGTVMRQCVTHND